MSESLDQLCINTIRMLSVDAVEKAKSGHPGAPMGLAPTAYVLWMRFLKYNPRNPLWPDRDRFVLSAGHGSMLLYSMLHLTGYDLPLEEIQRFRQWESRTPGHPERGITPGVETTTGPLGQGFGNGVGLAIAEAYLAARYNRLGFEIVDHFTYGIVSDGDLMEGVAAEAASLAGHLKLSNLCWIYDNNHITIEGNTRITFTEDVVTRFLAYGWNVLRVGDANDIERIEQALDIFRKTKGRPTFIVLDTHIGYGAPHKQDTAEAHGEPLGDEEVRLVKRFYGWPEDAKFLVPDSAYERFAAGVGARGARLRREWTGLFEAYQAQYPELANEIELMQRRELPEEWDRN
ncbi:MAG: transketolase, partial [Gammaproteobacteria bacterium]